MNSSKKWGLFSLGVCMAVTIIICLSGAKTSRLEKAFQRAESWAILETVKKGRPVIPKMLAGLHAPDSRHRQACRRVLYALWPQLTAKERNQAAAGQLAVTLSEIREDSGSVVFVLSLSCDIPGTMITYGEEVGLVVNGNHVATFKHDIETDLSIAENAELTTTLRLPLDEAKRVLTSSDRVQIVGRSWFGGSASVPEGPVGESHHKPQFKPDEFALDWSTVPVLLTSNNVEVFDKVITRRWR